MTGVQTCALPIYLTGDGVPKYIGTAEKAESLIVQNTTVAAGNFRSEERRVGKECER